MTEAIVTSIIGATGGALLAYIAYKQSLRTKQFDLAFKKIDDKHLCLTESLELVKSLREVLADTQAEADRLRQREKDCVEALHGLQGRLIQIETKMQSLPCQQDK